MTDEEANEICNKCAETTYDRGYRSGFNRGVELQNAKLKKAVKKIMVEIINDIQGISENPDYKPIGTYDYVTGSEDCRKVVLEIIDKHLKEVEQDG